MNFRLAIHYLDFVTKNEISSADGDSRKLEAFSFSGLLFHGLGCGKFTISVRFGAQGTRIQFARFLDRCATNSTRHRKYLFPGEFFGFHGHESSQDDKCGFHPADITPAGRKTKARFDAGFRSGRMTGKREVIPRSGLPTNRELSVDTGASGWSYLQDPSGGRRLRAFAVVIRHDTDSKSCRASGSTRDRRTSTRG